MYNKHLTHSSIFFLTFLNTTEVHKLSYKIVWSTQTRYQTHNFTSSPNTQSMCISRAADAMAKAEY